MLAGRSFIFIVIPCVYINIFINNIYQRKIDCRLDTMGLNIIVYADVLVILFPSFSGLFLFLDKVYNGVKELNFRFNPSNLFVIVFESSPTM